jgi:hypothetical protein
MSYPDQGGALVVKFGYDTSGNIISVGRAADPLDPVPANAADPLPYWRLMDVDGGMRPSLEQFANGVLTQYAYYDRADCDPAPESEPPPPVGTVSAACSPGLLKSVRTFNSGAPGTALLDEKYTYDETGNLAGKIVNGDLAHRQRFNYDFQNQLAATITHLTESLVASVPNAVDTAGDFTGGGYVYETDTDRPHVLDRINWPGGGTTEYTFDPNGSLQQRSGTGVPGTTQTFTYNDFGMPSKVVAGDPNAGLSTELEYDPSGSRVSKRRELPGSSPEVPLAEL